MASDDSDYPVRVRGDLDSPSRWMWIVKPILAVPHYPLLIVLYLIYPLVTIAAGVAVLFSGTYPRRIFEFNVGVLRWSWRVMFYRFPMIGTDRYPPFTLAARPDYPAGLDIDYPDRLQRWPVLVKWWLLGLPQYLILWAIWPAMQLIVLIYGFGLLFTGTNPPGLFDLLMGIFRWRYRVAVYASLMRDEYPPFRLDQGATG